MINDIHHLIGAWEGHLVNVCRGEVIAEEEEGVR